MKTVTAFFYFFGNILFPIALLWSGFYFVPPEFVLDREPILIENGVFKHLERLFPNLTPKQTFHYPGALAGLTE